MNTNEFVEKASVVHNGKYDYSTTVYSKKHSKVSIICPKHGVFEQIAEVHLYGSGCPKCAGRGKTTTDLISEFVEVHGSKYDYSKVFYTNAKERIEIVCPKHGSFAQKPFSHILGTGCPKCAKSVSSDEVRLLEYVEDWIAKHCDIKPAMVTNRSPDFFPNKQHLDIYIPDLKLAFEFNSKYWHSEKFGRGKEYHLNKFNWCKQAGVRLLNVWFEEWTKDTNNVKQIISLFLEGTLKEDVLIEKVWID